MKNNRNEEVIQAMQLLADGGYVEVRMLNVPREGTVSGYFNDYETLERTIRKYDGKTNIFVTLNPLLEGIEARSSNRLAKYAKNTASDKDIAYRQWILIDLDPIRPTGVSSTNAELHAAEKKAIEVEVFLAEYSFTEPIIAMSGNGYHLLYNIDMPNDENTTKLIKDFLMVLDHKFSNEQVKVDTSTHNAARITKLYGSIACKGDSTESRPHRQSYIVSAPEMVEPSNRQFIQNIINDNQSVPNVHQPKGEKPYNQYSLNAKEWLKNKGIAISREKPYDAGGICYVLEKCPWKPEEHVDRSAYLVQFPNKKIIAGCHHDSCRDQNWDTLKKLYGDAPSDKPEERKIDTEAESMSEILLQEIRAEGHIFFHDKEENSYVAIPGVHRVYMSLQEKQYKQYLRRLFYSRYGKSLSRDALQQTLDTLESTAIFDGEEREVYIRCKMENKQIFYYLADQEQSVVCIDKNGFRICEESPIVFLKRRNMLEQVMPIKAKKSLKSLTAKHWKFKTIEDKILHDVTLVTRFLTDFPMPIVIYMGERGAAKTTSMKMDKLLVDPATFLVKALTRSIGDLLTTLSNQYLVCFDNVDKLSSEMSDLFCICSTGGVYAKRKLYTDGEEYGVDLMTRLNFSCINMLSHRTDFYDRCIGMTLDRLTPSERKMEKVVMEEFNKDIPSLLGAIFEVLSKALTVFDEIELEELPRMADYAKWGYVIAEVLGYGGERFLQIYKQNQNDLNMKVIEEDSVATTVISYMSQEFDYFKGTVSELLQELTEHAQNNGVDVRQAWIKTPNALSRRINDLQSILEQFGVHVNRGKSEGIRYIELWKGDYSDE